MPGSTSPMSDNAAGESDADGHCRKRIRQACLNCRKKKVRCGGEKPVCTFCSRLSQRCIYIEDGRSARRVSMSHSAVDNDVGGNHVDIQLIAASFLAIFAPETSTNRLQENIQSKFESLEDRLCRIEGSLEGFLIPSSPSPPSTSDNSEQTLASSTSIGCSSEPAHRCRHERRQGRQRCLDETESTCAITNPRHHWPTIYGCLATTDTYALLCC